PGPRRRPARRWRSGPRGPRRRPARPRLFTPGRTAPWQHLHGGARRSPGVTMALDFSFTEEQELFRQTVREFLDEEIRPMMPRGFVEGHEFPWPIVRKL